MVDDRLIEYVKTHLKQGYSAENLKKYLIGYGYTAADIDAAFKITQKKKSPLMPLVIAAAIIITVMIIAIIAVVLLLPSPDGSSDNVAIKLTKITAEPSPGDDLLFNVELANPGSAGRFDVSLLHELKTGTSVVNTKTESISLQETASKESSIKIPDTAYPGNYILTTTASFDGAKKTSSISFTVIKKQVIIPGKCPACDDSDVCTTDTCSEKTGYKCVYTKKTPCCGNHVCESGETCAADCGNNTAPPPEPIDITNIQDVIDGAKEAVEEGGDAPGEFCSSISKASYRDACFEIVSKETADPSFCKFIATESKKDSCYINFAFEGNLDVCEEIINKYLKKSCFALKR